jgi:hypothetical protein
LVAVVYEATRRAGGGGSALRGRLAALVAHAVPIGAALVGASMGGPAGTIAAAVAGELIANLAQDVQHRIEPPARGIGRGIA